MNTTIHYKEYSFIWFLLFKECMKYIGVLALQGDFQKHYDMMRMSYENVKLFTELSELKNLSGLIIPGGESTTIGMLLMRRFLLEPLKKAIQDGLPVFGTCAGAILLAKSIEQSTQDRLAVMDISIARNAYGSQINSFETNLQLNDTKRNFEDSIEGVFIRAPAITSIGKNVEVLSFCNNIPVLVREGSILAASFHPELTKRDALHRYFLTSCVL